MDEYSNGRTWSQGETQRRIMLIERAYVSRDLHDRDVRALIDDVADIKATFKFMSRTIFTQLFVLIVTIVGVVLSVFLG